MINILIVDGQKVVREILKVYFANEPDLHVVGTASNIIEAVEKITILKPNIVFMDLELAGSDLVLEMIATKPDSFPEVEVIFLTDSDTEEYEQIASQTNDRAFLSKKATAEQLISSVRQVCKRSQLVAQEFNLSYVENGNSNGGLVRDRRVDHEKIAVNNGNSKLIAETNSFPNEKKQPPRQPTLKKYLGLGVLLNSLVWVFALAYLKLTPPSYTSQWGVKVLQTDSGVEVVLPDGGKASPAIGGWTPPTAQDTRNDYVFVATSPDLLTEAAAVVDMDKKEYKEPTIKVDEENGLITFQIEGSSPEEARVKARAFHETMTNHIKKLRKTELARQEVETQETLAKAKTKLVAAQEKLSQYRAKSDISTDGQIQNLTDNIESLRRQKAELASQQKGSGDRYAQLNTEIKSIASPNAGDAYKLAADPLYVQYQTNYAQIQSSLNSSLDRFTHDHPVVQEKRFELKNATRALQTRATRILGRSISLDALIQLAPLTLDPQSVLAREGLQQDLVNSRAEWQRLKAQTKELTVQISSLESRLRRMSQDQFKVDSLKRDLQVAETVFAATLAKLDLGKDNIYSIYPPLQLITKPNLPEEASNPNPVAVFMGGLAGSFLVTTGLALLWFDRKKFRYGSSESENSLAKSETIGSSELIVKNNKF